MKNLKKQARSKYGNDDDYVDDIVKRIKNHTEEEKLEHIRS